MTPDELFKEFESGFHGQKYTAGLIVAFIDMLTRLGVPGSGVASSEDFLHRFPKQEKTSTGKRANTLIVMQPNGKTLSLRGFYNTAERFYRAEHKRFDYPSAAPHATQAWAYYEHRLNALVIQNPAD